MNPLLSVIIVSWNGRRYLPACFEALVPQLPREAEVILVDNGSSDGTLEWASTAYPAVRLVALPANLGFAGGTNAGIRAARGELLLLLNNDAFAEPGCVDAFLAAAEAWPGAGAVAGVLTFAHRPAIVASAGLTARTDGLALDLWAGRGLDQLPSAPQPVMGASGGAMLVRRAMLQDVGLFEPWFFNYLEDVDLAWRALLRGWGAIVAPGARARHVYSATGGEGSPFKQRLLGRNRLAAIVRCWPAELLARCLARIVGYDALAVAYALARGRPAIVRGRLEALSNLGLLLAQRRAIQSGCSAPAAIGRWLEPAPPPWQSLRQQQWLAQVLSERQGEKPGVL
jgi:GT2 family glycosyltransferase